MRSDEGERLRGVRLRALAESPDAFAATHAEEAALPAAEWEARAAAGAAGIETVVFLALGAGGESLGMAGGRVRETPEIIALWGMWVDPAARGTGLGARLVEAVGAWARARRAQRFRLGVMSDAPAAIGFYERLGFVRVDELHPLVRDPTRTWIEMFRPL